jgi:hypothetical protein
MGCTEPAWALRVFLSPAEVVSFLLQHWLLTGYGLPLEEDVLVCFTLL